MTVTEVFLFMGIILIGFIITWIARKLIVVEVGARPPFFDTIDDKLRESEQITHDLLVVLSRRIDLIEKKLEQKPKKKVGRPKKKVIND